MTVFVAKPRRFGPVFAFYVVDDRALAPGQQSWYDQTDALATARGRECQNVFGPVMAKVVQSILLITPPSADVNAFLSRT